MMIRVDGKEMAARVRSRGIDPDFGGKRTITVTMECTAEEAKALFSGCKNWQSYQLTEDGTQIKLQDHSSYETMLQVQDHLDGTVSVIMGKATQEELLTLLAGDAVTRSSAKALRTAMETAAVSLDDKVASTAPEMFPRLKQDGSLIKAGTRFNIGGVVKRAAVDLWDTAENAPDKAPTLWEDLLFKDGVRMIPDVITAGTAFAKGEEGWRKGVIYVSLIDANVWTPEAYPAGWGVKE
ncbi:MAG: hypothetical protein J6J43_01170 [Oscillospiraceae bacterium]|nr:hypothetical protein [Oscillospiraceae bacterium]